MRVKIYPRDSEEIGITLVQHALTVQVELRHMDGVIPKAPVIGMFTADSSGRIMFTRVGSPNDRLVACDEDNAIKTVRS